MQLGRCIRPHNRCCHRTHHNRLPHCLRSRTRLPECRDQHTRHIRLSRFPRNRTFQAKCRNSRTQKWHQGLRKLHIHPPPRTSHHPSKLKGQNCKRTDRCILHNLNRHLHTRHKRPPHCPHNRIHLREWACRHSRRFLRGWCCHRSHTNLGLQRTGKCRRRFGLLAKNCTHQGLCSRRNCP